ncbi:MAG: hypothetical protein OXG10_07120 [Candidatus Dadabacteria bacterium]|nr:hypothetical protein [Candidatus Dadabacteria bacterium]
MNKNTMRSRCVEVFVITLITIQGLYVVFPLPDIWPFSNYSMFSKANPVTVASSFEFHGLTREGKEVTLDSKKAFLPLDKVRLEKGITKILNRESLVQKQEKELESAFKLLSFLPVDNAFLKKNVRLLLPYKKNAAVADKEKELRILFDYLLAQYEDNRKKKLHGGPPIVSMNLYLTRWDWTDVSPQEVFPESKLVYSSEYGLSEDE